MSRVALATLALAAGASAMTPPLVDSIVDYCVSSRWGFSCMRPRPAALLDLSGGRLPAALATVGRRSAQGCLLISACVLTREILRDVSDLKHPRGQDLDTWMSSFGRVQPEATRRTEGRRMGGPRVASATGKGVVHGTLPKPLRAAAWAATGAIPAMLCC